ncbi:HAMP domain-containing protein [Sphingomonas sp. PAMC26645]|uniref:ATP-binding protein n=1 Tax=Sphingomonas sp. PAMC26645 TaxID=2565555 RepID=UPI00109D94E7|nr:ATP-binding protein [Sphingomonas sp. PAMC26645]QCB43669.1 HAMP domain-containing protein [Sphingomonas sp. PAMC26645]
MKVRGGGMFGMLGTRIAAIILVHAAILTALVYFVFFGVGEDRRPMFRLPHPDDVAAMVEAIERSTPAARPYLLRAFARDGQHVTLLAAFPMTQSNRPDAIGQAVTGRLAAKLAVVEPAVDDVAQTLTTVTASYRAVMGARRFAIQTDQGRALTDFGGGRIMSDTSIRVLVALRGGMVLAVDHAGFPVVGRVVSYIVPLTLFILLLDIVAIVLLARQTTRPVAMLLRVVQTDRHDGAQPIWPTSGPREIRELAFAFAAMRVRLHGLVAERTRILAAVAHDFRTYLTRLELRSDHIGDPRQRALALNDLDEMGALLDDTLTFATDTMTGSALPNETTDLTEEIRQTVIDRADLGERIGLSSLPAVLPARISHIAFQRVLANLLDNAVRYGATPSISAERRGELVLVFVEDDGPGVPEASLAGLTEPFRRLETSRARHTGGAGLGLAIVLALVQRHGGSLTLENRSEGGFRAGVSLRAA